MESSLQGNNSSPGVASPQKNTSRKAESPDDKQKDVSLHTRAATASNVASSRGGSTVVRDEKLCPPTPRVVVLRPPEGIHVYKVSMFYHSKCNLLQHILKPWPSVRIQNLDESFHQRLFVEASLEDSSGTLTLPAAR